MVSEHPSDPGKAQTNEKFSYLNIINPCTHHKGFYFKGVIVRWKWEVCPPFGLRTFLFDKAAPYRILTEM